MKLFDKVEANLYLRPICWIIENSSDVVSQLLNVSAVKYIFEVLNSINVECVVGVITVIICNLELNGPLWVFLSIQQRHNECKQSLSVSKGIICPIDCKCTASCDSCDQGFVEVIHSDQCVIVKAC